MTKRLSKKGAQAVSTDLDRLANLFEHDFETLGVEERIAADFALRCDMLSDHLEKVALTGDDVVKEQGFDPDDIGRETSGPLENEPDEPYMKGEFDQQENRELREKQQDGDISPDRTSPEPQKPRPGVQAAFGDLTMALGTGGIPKEAAAQIEKALHLATKVVRQAKGKIPEALKGFQFEKKDDKDGDDKKDDDKGDEKEGGKKKKKASDHGYDLTAE